CPCRVSISLTNYVRKGAARSDERRLPPHTPSSHHKTRIFVFSTYACPLTRGLAGIAARVNCLFPRMRRRRWRLWEDMLYDRTRYAWSRRFLATSMRPTSARVISARIRPRRSETAVGLDGIRRTRHFSIGLPLGSKRGIALHVIHFIAAT